MKSIGPIDPIRATVPHGEDNQQGTIHQQPLWPEPECPAEWHALEEAEEQRWVAERRE